ncbi:MAG: sirohydrochlorin cobaltochelatase [Methanosaeta sp. ASP1-2]|nr:MAG: sirohydrochlorin cobaltochelatase [Methanosaeta sp. ASP1-2]
MNLSFINTRFVKSNTGVSMKDVGILILGHGSSLPYNKELVESLARMIGENHAGPVRTAYLNMNQPNIPEGLKSFAGTNVKTIVALPLFLAHGVHTRQDIPQEMGIDPNKRRGTLKIGGEEVEVICAEPLGVDECIATLACKRAEEALR